MSGSMFVIALSGGFIAAPVLVLIGGIAQELLLDIRDAFDRRFKKR